MEAANTTIESVLTFLGRQGIIEYTPTKTAESVISEENDIFNIKTPKAGLFESLVTVGERVKKGQPMANIIDPYEGEIVKTILYFILFVAVIPVGAGFATKLLMEMNDKIGAKYVHIGMIAIPAVLLILFLLIYFIIYGIPLPVEIFNI